MFGSRCNCSPAALTPTNPVFPPLFADIWPARPVKTFDSACTYYHKFRLSFRDAEYNFQDAALACLFVACKVEDTIKKSREILCAAYNLKNPDKPTTQDDKVS